MLPFVSESAVYDRLHPKDFASLFFASKSMKAQVIRYISSMHRLVNIDANLPFEQLVVKHSTNLRAITLDRDYYDIGHWLAAVILRNERTLVSVRGPLTLSGFAALARCRLLEEFASDDVRSDDAIPKPHMSALLQRLLTADNFPRLRRLALGEFQPSTLRTRQRPRGPDPLSWPPSSAHVRACVAAVLTPCAAFPLTSLSVELPSPVVVRALENCTFQALTELRLVYEDVRELEIGQIVEIAGYLASPVSPFAGSDCRLLARRRIHGGRSQAHEQHHLEAPVAHRTHIHLRSRRSWSLPISSRSKAKWPATPG